MEGLSINVMVIRELSINDKEKVPELANLHKLAFPSFFLSQLGLPFLRTLYSGYLEDINSGIIIAACDGSLLGFIAYSKDYPGFYKGLIKKHIIRFALCSVGAVIRHPKIIKRLLGAFGKSNSVVKSEKYVELASICVDPATANRGIGSALIEYLKGIVDFNSYAYINLETDAYGNDGVNEFYVKNGFRLARAYSTAEGRRMNEYRYTPGIVR